eukprot:TRINITY_DN3632_c0_g1_i1.p1 TRINITY_DN3632_c0_g1~~TRINITY_DN3632_c0_g1_i1.p1  ORF type:complete len:98 (+),score=30.19 TRINITY_DN3632_c0_g1_i1:179-472(+)
MRFDILCLLTQLCVVIRPTLLPARSLDWRINHITWGFHFRCPRSRLQMGFCILRIERKLKKWSKKWSDYPFSDYKLKKKKVTELRGRSSETAKAHRG